MEDLEMFVSPRRGSPAFLVAAIVLFAMSIAPTAFARGHVGVSIGFSGPGYSIGYADYGRGYRGWSGAAYGGYGSYGGYGAYDTHGSFGGYGGYGSYGYGGGHFAPAYTGHSYPIVDRGYYYDFPRYSNVYYRTERPLTRRVVRREVRYYDVQRNSRDDGYRGDSYRNDQQYQRREQSYGRASYYDRDN